MVKEGFGAFSTAPSAAPSAALSAVPPAPSAALSSTSEACSNDLCTMDEDPVFTFDEDVDERTSLPTYDALVESGRIVVASNQQNASDSGNLMIPPRRPDDDVKVQSAAPRWEVVAQALMCFRWLEAIRDRCPALYERICTKLAPFERPQTTEFSSVHGVGLRVVQDALRINITLYTGDSSMHAQQGLIIELFPSDLIEFSFSKHDSIALRSN